MNQAHPAAGARPRRALLRIAIIGTMFSDVLVCIGFGYQSLRFSRAMRPMLLVARMVRSRDPPRMSAPVLTRLRNAARFRSRSFGPCWWASCAPFRASWA